MSETYFSPPPIQPPVAEKAAAQLEEEARSFALRLKHVSKFAWSQYLRAVSAGTSHLVGAARKIVREPTDGTMPIRTAGAVPAAMSAKPGTSPTVSPRAGVSTMELMCNVALVRGGNAGGVTSFANPLQAAFLNRTRLVEVDDEYAAKCKHQWESTRAWTWGYQTQCRWNKAAAEADERSLEERERSGGTEVETKAVPMGKGAPSAAAASDGSGNRVGTGVAAAGVLPMSASGSLVQRGGGEGVGARGGREDVSAGKRGFTPSNSRLLRMSPPIVPRASDSGHSVAAGRGDSNPPLKTPEPAAVRGGAQGFSRTKVPSPAPLPTSRDNDVPVQVSGMPGTEAKNQRSFAPFSSNLGTRMTATTARVAAVAGLAAAGSATTASAVTADVDGRPAPAERALLDRGEAALQPLDGLQNVMRQCRLHRMAVYPLLLPIPPLPPSPNMLSAKGSPRGDNGTGGDAGVVETAFRSPAHVSQFSGAWGGDCAEEEGRWGPGRWDTILPLDGRKPGPGAVGSVGAIDATASPKDWMSSSSPAVAFSTGSIAGTSGGGVSVGGFESGRFSLKDKPLTQSADFDLADHVRSRSATSSGPGNYSFDSTLDPEERSDSLGAPISRLLQHGEIPAPPPPPPLHVKNSAGSGSRAGSSGLSAREGEGDSSGMGREARQTRSASLAVLGGEWTRAAEIGTGSSARRKSSAVDQVLIDAPASSTPTDARTTEDSRKEADSGAVETEAERAAARAAVLARQFVDAYSDFLIDSLGFTPVTCGKGTRGTINSGDQKGRPACSGAEAEAATPDPSENFDSTAWETSPQGSGGGGGGGDDDSSTANHSSAGGDTLARGCLRLALEMTNTVVLVDVGVSIVHGEAVAGAAGATAEHARRVWTSEVPGAAGVQRHQHCPFVVTDTLLASVKLWTVDVVEPTDGWKGDGPVGTSGGGGAPSWWASQPTLSTFAWNVNPSGPLLEGECLPGELPRELHRVIDGLHFRNSVEDFGIGQVSRSLRA